jgi:serine/threonine protein kinase
MRGNLCNDDLLNIIDSLSTSRKEGVLSLTHEDHSIRIFFKNGNIVFASSNNEKDRLGQILVRAGKVKPADLEMALQMMERTGLHLGTTLVEMGLLEQGELATYARRRVTSIIQSSMGWSEGEYVFEEQEVSSSRVETITLMTSDVLVENDQNGGDGSEEILAVLGDLNNVLRQPKNPLTPYDDGSLSSSLEWILYQANGVSTINEIVAHSPMERAKTLQSIFALVSAGLLEVESPSNAQANRKNDSNPDATNVLNDRAALAGSQMCNTDTLPAESLPEKLGRYNVIERLGSGAMGAVYLAKDPTIDRIVAIKLIQTASQLTNESLVKYKERFYQEAKAAGKLLHPGIVAVFDVGHADNGMPFLVMEYVRGKTLQELLEKESLTVIDAIDLSLSILDALGYAHRNGIVHRDIKPSNIAVAEGGCAKIMDFGIAHVIGGELTNTDEVLGSLNYMAPEQLAKQKIDQRTDLFAFGVVIFRMLTGRLPFEGESIAEVAQSILNDQPPAPSSINPDISSDLEGIVLRCLEKDPANRFEHTEKLRQALTSAKASIEEANPIISGLSPKKSVAKYVKLIVAASLLAFTAVALPYVSAPSKRSAPDALAQAKGLSEEPNRPMNLETEPTVTKVDEVVEVDEVPPPAPSEPGDAELFYQANMTFERGDLLKSKLYLERLLKRSPSFSGAAELQARVQMELWKQRLPLSILASHDHRIGSCTGTLTLTTSGIRFESDEHKWDWSFFEMRILDRRDPSELFIETHEKDVLILGKPKRFRFKLAIPLKEDDWGRLQYLAKYP